VRVRHDFLPPVNTKLNRCKLPRACWLLTKEWPLTSLSYTGRAENLHSKHWWIIYSMSLPYTSKRYFIYFRSIELDGMVVRLGCHFQTYDSRWCGGTPTISRIKVTIGDSRCSVWPKLARNCMIPASCSQWTDRWPTSRLTMYCSCKSRVLKFRENV